MSADVDAAREPLQRYDLTIEPDDSAYMELDPEGPYVLFDDIDAFEAAIRAEAGTLDRVTLVKLIEDHVDIGDYSNGSADIEGLADAILAHLAGADRE